MQQRAIQRRSRAHAREVEERLTRIQDANRLALHTFESDDEKRLVPKDKLAELEYNAALLAAPRTTDVEKKDVPLTSMTSIPSRSSRRAAHPFDLNGYGQPVSYLFDLSVEQAVAPVVVRAMETSRFTDYNNRDKKLYLFRDTIPPDMEPIYGKFKIDADCLSEDGGRYYLDEAGHAQECALLNAALRDPKHFATALDAVQKIHSQDREKQWSEIMVAVAPTHIAAIAMPVSTKPPTYQKTDQDRLNEASDMYCAALSGLAHLKQGMDLPVVSYGIGPKHKGRITYLAQGQDELRDLALRSLDVIQKHPLARHDGEFNLHVRVTDLDAATRELLDVDMEMPLAKQGIKLSGNARGV